MSSKAGLIAAAFSAHFGIPIKSEEEAKAILKQQTGRCSICGQIHNDNPISALSQIESWNQSNNDGDTASGMAGLKKALGSTLISSGTYWYGGGPHPLYYIKNENLEPTKDFDFTNTTKSSCNRGGYNYERPFGWDRCALKVKGKYKDDIWLGEDGWRENSTPREWVVSYHGTEMANIGSIADEGYKSSKNVRELYGPGTYSTPSVEVAASYAAEFTYENKKYKMVLQNRVNLSESKEIPASVNGTNASYFVTRDESNIRPYGVCLKCISPDNSSSLSPYSSNLRYNSSSSSLYSSSSRDNSSWCLLM